MPIDVPDEFRSFLRTEEARASDTALNEARATALKAYQGDKYGDEEEGRSQAVTRDVSEVVDFMSVGILGTIMAGGKPVEFDTEPEELPTGETDEQGQPKTERKDYGAEATAAVHYQFMRKQKGYRILHDALKAGMLEKTGIVKTFVEQRYATEQVTVPRVAINDDDLTLDGHQIISAEPADDPAFEEAATFGLAGEAERPHNVVVKRPLPPTVRDQAVPNEWFLVSPDTIELDDSPYVGDKMPVSISDLVAMGYEYGELEPIWSGADAQEVVERARDTDRSNDRNSIGSRRGPNRILWLHTEYPLYDLNGDGIAERLFVHRIGQHVLNVMGVEEQPYSGWSPMPMQHRFVGQSMADKTMDIQRIRSVLLRQGLDSLYQTTSPRMLVDESGMTADTIDDLLTVRPGALIRYKNNPPAPLATADSSPTSFNAMEMMSAERESRTGVTRQSQGLNPDTTNKTASGMAMLQANGDQIELYVTRNYAEMLVAPMFGKRYRLTRQHVQPFRMKIDGVYTLVDPSKWPDDPDMQINVGLGTGSREQRIAFRREVIEMQQAAHVGGLRIVDEEKFYNSAKAFVDDTNLGVATDFFNDPSQLGPVPEKPDPDAAKVQADAMVQAQKDQQAHQQVMTKLQLQQEAQQAENALKAQQNDYDLQAKRESAVLDAQLKQSRAEEESRLAWAKLVQEAELRREEIRLRSAQNDDSLPTYRAGGDLAS